MNVLSLFDGISVTQQALKELCIDVNYYASEINKHAIEVTIQNHPDTIQLGDVKKITYENKYLHSEKYESIFIDKIDLLVGGFPCQDLSICGSKKGLDGERSGLFYEMVRIHKETNPTYFIYENVASMSTENKNIISNILGIEPVLLDAKYVSAQCRKRYFWSNIKMSTPLIDKKIYLKDILEPNIKTKFVECDFKNIITKFYCGCNASNKNYPIRLGELFNKQQQNRIYGVNGKSVTLLTTNAPYYLIEKNSIRKLTSIEMERLQSLPDNYTSIISQNKRMQCLGNAFNKEIIKYIIGHIQ